MIVTVPITGKLVSYDPKTRIGVGSDESPIAPLDFNKLLPEGCDFRWDAVLYDYEEGVAIVEVTFAKQVTVTEWDGTKDPPEPIAWRRETDAEFYRRQAATEKVIRDTLEGRSADELYEVTKEPRVVMPCAL